MQYFESREGKKIQEKYKLKIEKVNAPPSKHPRAFSLTKGVGCNKFDKDREVQ